MMGQLSYLEKIDDKKIHIFDENCYSNTTLRNAINAVIFVKYLF